MTEIGDGRYRLGSDDFYYDVAEMIKTVVFPYVPLASIILGSGLVAKLFSD